MVQIRALQRKAPRGFRFWRKVKVRIRRRRQLLKENFDYDCGRACAELDSDDADSGDQSYDFQRNASWRRVKPEIFRFSPCWGFAAGSGRLLRLACKKFLFRPDSLISWTLNAREREREKEPAHRELIFSDSQGSFSDRSWEPPEKERGKLKIGSWVNGRCRWSLREHLFGDSEDGEEQGGGGAAEKRKEDGWVGGEDGCYGCSGGRNWRSRSKSRKEGDESDTEFNNRKKGEENLVGAIVDDKQPAALPDDIIEMCLARTPFASLMRARAVCKKWKSLTSSLHFLHMRNSIPSSDPWLFLFGLSRKGICSGQIQALDPASSTWHTINADILTGRVSYSVTAVNSTIYVVGGCSSSLRTTGSGSRSDNKDSLRTLNSVLRYTPITGSWKKVCPLTTERASPIVGVFIARRKKTPWSDSNMRGRVDRNWASAPSSPVRKQICERGSRRGGELAVYGEPEFRMRETSITGNTIANTIATRQKVFAHLKKSCSQDERYSYGFPEGAEFERFDVQGRRRTEAKEQQTTFGLIAVGGQGTWNEQLDSAEIYDPVTDRWREIASLPADHGTSCAGVVCKNFFYVYSESNKLAAYDLERDVWHSIRVSQDPARLLDYAPKLVSCRDRVFLLGVAWGLPSDGSGSEMATREIWELRQEPGCTGWVSVSQHPDAPLDWNAAFVADEERIFGVEMFKIFGQMLDFVTVCKISPSGGMAWERVSRLEMAMNGMDPSSCLTKTALVVRL